MEHIAESAQALFPIFNEAQRLWQRHGYLRVILMTEKPRTLPQNSFTHKWYELISKELKEAENA